MIISPRRAGDDAHEGSDYILSEIQRNDTHYNNRSWLGLVRRVSGAS
jgi:hypothetical protein